MSAARCRGLIGRGRCLGCGPLLAATVVSIWLAGCGGTGAVSRPGGPGPGSGPGADGSSGQALFHRNCQSCHSLSGPATRRQQGGSLHGLRLPAREITQFVAEMPRLHGTLTRVQVQTITRYLVAVEGR